MLDPYNHAHSHFEEISWSKLNELLIRLAETIQRDYRPDLVVGIAKGGVIPGVYLSSAFRVDFLPIKLSCRNNEEIISTQPIWRVYPTDLVKGKRVLVVDDIIIAARTLKMAVEEIRTKGAKEIRTATLAAHSDSIRPDWVAFVTDALIIWPWDRDMLTPEGKWIMNPEYMKAIRELPDFHPASSPKDEEQNG